MSDYELTPVDRKKLQLLIADDKSSKELVLHYKEVHKAYREMGKRGKDNFFIIKKNAYAPKSSKVISRLAEDIMELDGDLYMIVTHKGLKDTIGLSFKEVCLLFSKNSLTDSPVMPEEI